VWIRVPKGTSLKDIYNIGHRRCTSAFGTPCYGSEICICARAFGKNSGIVVHGPKEFEFSELMKKAGFKPQPKCFGGDCCIV
jgi:hypothetical protein